MLTSYTDTIRNVCDFVNLNYIQKDNIVSIIETRNGAVTLFYWK